MTCCSFRQEDLRPLISGSGYGTRVAPVKPLADTLVCPPVTLPVASLSPSRGGGRGVHRPKRHLGVVVLVVPVPPAVRGLRIALGRVLLLFLPAERGHVEVAPGAPQRLVAS